MMPFRTRRRSAWLGFATLLGTMFTLTAAAPLHAQVLSDPRVAEFDPSPDHWTTLESGEPAVLRYDLAVYLLGASTPFGTVDMGKPSPEADGKIRYDFSSQVTAWTLPGGNYEARVSAVGPEGEALSSPSNPFTFTNPSQCTISLTPPTVEAAASGGNYAASVSTGEGCGWAVTSVLTWVTAWTPSGSGGGTVSFEVQANSSLSSRTGTVTVGDQTLTVWQAGAPPCSYALSPASASVAAAGGSTSFTVTAASGCSWTAAPAQSWTSITGGSGSGNGTVSVSVAANTTTSARTGTVSVQGQTFTVTQAAAPAPCTYGLSPASYSAAAGGASTSFGVTASSSTCSWTASSDQSWITASSSTSSGNGTVTVAVAANTTTSARTGTVSVQGQTFAVTQAAAPAPPECSYSVTPGSFIFTAVGGDGVVGVTSPDGCPWNVVSDQVWLVPAVLNGSGKGSVVFAVKPNNAAAVKVARMTIGPWVVTVTEDGKLRRVK